ncbi:MAG: hypothetical protein DRO01_00760 [Thermoproteota archaeon]|nr:MAG: hypothetical protein DRO01_00760 [Candidatus Korarchaeota archaeon]
MGFFRKIFGRREDEEEEYYDEYYEEEGEYEDVEGLEDIPPVHPSMEEKPLAIKPVDLRSMTDIDLILGEVSDNNIVIVRYDELANKSSQELRIALQQLKEKVQRMGGEVVLIKTEDYPPLLVVPSFVAVWSSPKEE